MLMLMLMLMLLAKDFAHGSTYGHWTILKSYAVVFKRLQPFAAIVVGSKHYVPKVNYSHLVPSTRYSAYHGVVHSSICYDNACLVDHSGYVHGAVN